MGGGLGITHDDHVALLRGGVAGAGPCWADLGSGWGAFTLALADLLGPAAVIHAVDRDASSLRELGARVGAAFPGAHVERRVADFNRDQGSGLGLVDLDGVVMANSLHYSRRKEPVLELVRRMLKPGGRLILVEYNADRGNPWVPWPISYRAWERLAERAGFTDTRLLNTFPSRFLNEIYSASSSRP